MFQYFNHVHCIFEVFLRHICLDVLSLSSSFRGNVKRNKHKFVQKVAKKNIKLISFEFNTSICSTIIGGLQDQMRLNSIK